MALAIGSLAACQNASDAPDSEADPAASASPAPVDSPAPVSILRPDIEQPTVQPTLLEPLVVSLGFSDGGTDLDEETVAAMEHALESAQNKAGGPIVLRSHTDAAGSDRVNERMSQQRGDVVRDWLVERGIDEARITVIAFGEQNPVEPNALPDGTPNEAGRAANRRVDMTIDLPIEESDAEAAKSEAEPARGP